MWDAWCLGNDEKCHKWTHYPIAQPRQYALAMTILITHCKFYPKDCNKSSLGPRTKLSPLQEETWIVVDRNKVSI